MAESGRVHHDFAPLPTAPAERSGIGWVVLRVLTTGPFRITIKEYAETFCQGPHAHECGTIDFNLAGGGTGVNAGMEVESLPGEVEVFAPGCEHSFKAGPSGIRTMHVSFGPEAVEEWRNDVGPPDWRQTDHAAAVGIASRLLAELRDGDESTALAAEALGYQLMAAATRWKAERGPERGARWLGWVRDRLHAGGGASLSELALLAGVHRAHLARSFSAEYGVSVGEYERRLRIAGAARRLARGREGLARVAREAGFADQAHLTRWCSRVMGVTPGAFERAMRRERDGLRTGR